MYRAVVRHQDLGRPLAIGPCDTHGEASAELLDALSVSGFTVGHVERHASGFGWERCDEAPDDDECGNHVDWIREAKFEHARQTGRV